jgi:hypothetical protein
MQRIVAAACVVLAFTAPDGRVVVRIEGDGPVARGQPVPVTVGLAEASHLLVLRIDTEGRARVLVPARPWDDSTVGGEIAAGFTADEPDGIGYVLAVASTAPFELAAIAPGGDWDLRGFPGRRVTGDPYAALSRFAAQVAPDERYDYDIAPYHVGRRYDYPRFVCYDCHSAAAPGWDAYGASCTRFGLVVYDDPAHYPYRQYERRAVMPTRPAALSPRYEFRARETATPAIVNRRRDAGLERPGPGRTQDEAIPRGDSARPVAPARPRSLGEPELRRRPRPKD